MPSSGLRAHRAVVVVEAAAVAVPLIGAVGPGLDLVPEELLAGPLDASLAQQPDIGVDLVAAHAVADRCDHAEGRAFIAPGQLRCSGLGWAERCDQQQDD